jgi:hypothetical protein
VGTLKRSYQTNAALVNRKLAVYLILPMPNRMSPNNSRLIKTVTVPQITKTGRRNAEIQFMTNSKNIQVLLGSFLTSLSVVVLCGCLFLCYKRFLKVSETKLKKSYAPAQKQRKSLVQERKRSDEVKQHSEKPTSKTLATQTKKIKQLNKVESGNKLLFFFLDFRFEFFFSK